MKRYPQGMLVSCEIPWDERTNLFEEVFRREVRTLQAGFPNVYIFGTAGEGYAVDTPASGRSWMFLREETRAAGTRPQVGVIALSVPNVIERIEYAYTAGFRNFQISLPSWGALNDFEVLTFFKDVCGTFPDAWFLHYNLPRAKRLLTASDYRRIVDAVPNFAATKKHGNQSRYYPSYFLRLPNCSIFWEKPCSQFGCLYGECSLLSSFAAMIPSKTREFFERSTKGDFGKAFPCSAEYLKMVWDVLRPTEGDSHIDGAL